MLSCLRESQEANVVVNLMGQQWSTLNFSLNDANVEVTHHTFSCDKFYFGFRQAMLP